jgi:hypothetical protein
MSSEINMLRAMVLALLEENRELAEAKKELDQINEFISRHGNIRPAPCCYCGNLVNLANYDIVGVCCRCEVAYICEDCTKGKCSKCCDWFCDKCTQSDPKLEIVDGKHVECRQ